MNSALWEFAPRVANGARLTLLARSLALNANPLAQTKPDSAQLNSTQLNLTQLNSAVARHLPPASYSCPPLPVGVAAAGVWDGVGARVGALGGAAPAARRIVGRVAAGKAALSLINHLNSAREFGLVLFYFTLFYFTLLCSAPPGQRWAGATCAASGRT